MMKHSAKVMSRLVLSVILLCVLSANSTEAEQIELSVATDQGSYWPNEAMTVSVTAYNPNDYEVTLQFGSTFQASYIMDGVYDWSSDRGFFLMLTEVAIGPGSSHTWGFNHDWEYTSSRGSTYGYDLSIGTHSVVGALKKTGWSPDAGYTYMYYSQAVEFEILPEPAIVEIDIRPGNEQNPLNLESNGVLPVAIFGEDGFDVYDIDLSSLSLDGATPKQKGKSGKVGSFKDINGDDLIDLLLHFELSGLDVADDATELTLDGFLNDGTGLTGSDAIWLVGPGDGNGDGGQIVLPDWATPLPSVGDGGLYAIPEPATLGLLLLGGLAMLIRKGWGRRPSLIRNCSRM